MPNSQAPHWSKDFVEHLRTVHFALIAISAGLILLLFSSKQYNAVTALVQMEEILDLKKQWSIEWIKAHGNHLPNYVVSDEKTRLLHESRKEIRVIPVDEPGVSISGLYVDGKTKNQVLFKCHVPNETWFHVTPTAFNWSPSSFPRTLKDFEKWWAALDQTAPVYFPIRMYTYWFIQAVNPGPYTSAATWSGFLSSRDHREEDVPQRENLSPSQTKYQSIDVTLTAKTIRDYDYILKPGHEGEMFKAYFYYYDGTYQSAEGLRDLGIFITDYSAYSITQSSVSLVFKNLQPGQFNVSFRDLSIAAHDEADLPLETVKEFLHDEASKGPEVFEAFGMKFPAGQITFWGIVLLLGVQLYFLVYLRQLFGKLRPDDPGWDVPWIAMDSSGLSKTILFVSVVILPCIAAILLGWQASVRLSSDYWERSGNWFHPIHFLAWPWNWHYIVILKIFSLILAAVASSCLGRLSWKFRPQLAPEEPSCSPQLFE